ncbi:hypothetical protein C0991_002163 [Blastosporella zonata]|nr:hypothetical protein C0991_002163 [Blastosporella zonata]
MTPTTAVMIPATPYFVFREWFPTAHCANSIVRVRLNDPSTLEGSTHVQPDIALQPAQHSTPALGAAAAQQAVAIAPEVFEAEMVRSGIPEVLQKS